MTDETAPSPDRPADPTLEVAERQLAMLGELGQMAMRVSRAYEASAIASAQAARSILNDKFFMPEVGRANACGAKDAAESFQKVTRALRLTLMLEKATAEFVRDLRAGVVTAPTAATSARDAKAARLVIGDSPAPSAPRLDVDGEGEAARVERPGGERERRVDIEHLDRLPKGSYCRLVDGLAADIGGSVDWESATVSAPDLREMVPPPIPPGRGEARDGLATVDREMALSP